MQQAASARGLRLRPHAKTHKSPVIAMWQIDRGAVGICCAKVGEAEVMAAAGVDDIRLAYPINPSNAPRLLPLMERASLSIALDHMGVARAWSDAMRRADRTLDLLGKGDGGVPRVGNGPGCAESPQFHRAVGSLPGLRLRGLLSHAGQGYQATTANELCIVAQREVEILTTLRDRAAKDG